MNADHVVTSVVIPIRNEEAYIEQCLHSLLRQDYPVEKMEVFFVDGASVDKTCEIVQKYCGQYSHLHLLNNPDKTVPYAMNIGIKASSGRYIVRLDAHSAYAGDYISQCIACLERTDADNVGGVAQTQGQGLWGNAIALMLSSKFGVGNSSFRVGAEDGYVDTVPFGAFRREVFDRYGLYDTRLTRNQDNEMNYRIRKKGGKIYLSNEIQLTYFCRDSVGAIAKMGFQNGKWNIITSFLCPGTMGLRHFIPLVFVLSIVILGVLSLGAPHMLWPYVLLAEGVCYVLASGGYALSLAGKKGMRYFLPLLGLFPLFHICYGVGSLLGFLSPIIRTRRK
ncbi:MAG: glycosyltransferase family 2 protein [Peptococcaceae bacterium]|nr:glycosyltransferase family 2 protein [Peptococcaceae bacterium]